MLVLRDVDIESASATALIVLAATATAAGREAAVRLTAAGRQVTLRIRATHCHPVLVDGRRRFRIVYAVLGPEDRATA